MTDDVQSAVIAAGASIAVSIASLATAIWTTFQTARAAREQAATATELEKVKSQLTDQNDASKAKRDYEYEARKRLYADLYPLAFQLQEATLKAQHRVTNLALAARRGWLDSGPDGWLTSPDPYYITSCTHIFVAPLALEELMSRRLTLFDLTLDPDLRRQHFVVRQAFEALASDFDLAADPYPPISFGSGRQDYAPPEIRPPAMDEVTQRWAWRQGLYTGQIGQVVETLITSTETSARLMNFAEFASALGATDLRAEGGADGRAGELKRGLQPMIELLRDFHPARRPVTWRILLTQAACYRALDAARDGGLTLEQIVESAKYENRADLAAFDWIGPDRAGSPAALRDLADYPAEARSAMAAADLFLESSLKGFR
jgi:hypothetical protein